MKNTMMKKNMTTIALVLFTFASLAQTFKQLEGPFGGNISNLFFDGAKSKLYAVANNKVAYSSDNGVNWTLITPPEGYKYVYDAFFDGNKLLIATGNILASTTDNGGTWTIVNSKLNFNDAIRRIYKMPGTGMYLLMGDLKMQISVDAGVTWKQLLSFNYYDITDIDFTSAGDILIGDKTKGIRKYTFPSNPTDLASWNENNWVTIFPKAVDQNDFRLEMALTSADRIFMSYSSPTALSFQSSTDGGATWQPISSDGISPSVYIEPLLAVSPTGKLWLLNPYSNNNQTPRGLWEFTEGAPTPWASKPWPTTTITDQPVNAIVWKTNTQVFAGASIDGIFASSNSGNSWSVASTGLKFGDGRQVEVTADGKIVLVQGYRPSVYWYSTNQGLTWSTQSVGYPIAKLYRLPDNTLIMVAGGFIHTSSDGLNWTSYTSNSIVFNELSIVASNDIYGFAEDATIWESLDKGATWTQIPTTGYPTGFTIENIVARDDDGYFYVNRTNHAGSAREFWKLDSNVSPWTATQFHLDSEDGRYPETMFCLNNKIYITYKSHLNISTDKGATWKDTNIFTLGAIALRQPGGLTAIAVPSPGTFSVTQDDGKTFTSIPMSENFAYVTDMTLSADGTKYIASATGSPALEFAISATNKLIYPPSEAPEYIDFGWQEVEGGPFGGELTHMVKSPGGQLFVAGQYNVFRYNDSAAKWEKLTKQFRGVDVLVDNAGTLFILSDVAVYRSTDNGDTFVERPLQPSGTIESYYGRIIKNDVGDLLITTPYAGILRSTDNGDTYATVTGATGVYTDITVSTSGILLASNETTLISSTDKGATWTPVTFTGSGTINSIAALEGGRLAVVTKNDVMMSSDDGNTWTSIKGDFPLPQDFSFNLSSKLFLSPNNEYWFAHATYVDNSIYVSTNHGQNWVKRGVYKSSISAMVWNGSTAIASHGATRFGPPSVSQSTDNGATFVDFQQKGISNLYYSSFTQFRNKIYILAGSSLLATSDKGVTWTESVTGNTVTRGVLQSNDGGLLAWGFPLAKTMDGVTWTKINSGNLDFQALVSTGVSYFALDKLGHIQTSNDLTTWTEVAVPGFPPNYLATSIAADATGVVYFQITGQKVYQLSSGTVTQLTFTTNPRNFVYKNDKMYLYDGDGKLFTTTNGLTWNTLTVPRGGTFTITGPNYFFIDGGNGVLWLSRDQGKVWQNVGTNQLGSNFRQIILDELSGLAYAYDVGKPVLKSSGIVMTNDHQAPAIAKLLPAHNSTGVLPTSKLSITFDEGVIPVAGKKIKIVEPTNTSGFVESIDVSAGDQVDRTFTFTPAASSLKYSPNAATTQSYFITLEAGAFTDLFGNSTTPIINNTVWSFSMAVTPDAVAPAITFQNSNATSALKNGDNSKTVQVTITDAVGVTQAQILYRPITTEANFTTLVLTRSTGDIFEGSLPSSAYNPIGIEFYITASDAAGNIARSPVNGSHYAYITFPEGKKTTLANALPAGSTAEDYRIISVPFSASDNSVDAVLVPAIGERDSKVWRLLTLNSEQSGWDEYPKDFTNLIPGIGYWIIYKNGGAISLNVDSSPNVNRENLFSMTLAPGWNQIGNPYPFPMVWSEVLSANGDPPGLRAPKVYKAGAYNDVEVIATTEGAFVHNLSPSSVTLNIPLVTSASGGRIKSISSDLGEREWIVPILLKCGPIETNIGGVGMSESANISIDDLDDFNPPSFQNTLQMEFPHPEHKIKFVARDVVDTRENYTWNFKVNTNTTQTTEFSWDNEAFGNNSRELFLFDVSLQKPVNMRQTGRYIFDPKVSGSFRIYFGEDLEEKIKPDFVLLGDAYPSPSAGQTTIPFALPDQSNVYHVKLEVYDMLGKKISTLHHGDLTPGFHRVAWDAENMNEGIYLYRLSVSAPNMQSVQTKKIALQR